MLIAALGARHLADPITGDQALFLLGAQTIADGGALYVDFWDLKQPGIYWFFTAGGRLFGFTAAGVRLFELAWMLALAAVLCAALRPCLRRPALAAVAPLAVLGVYYGRLHPFEMLQLEALVPLPAFLCAWLLSRRYPSLRAARWGWAAAGAAGAVVVVFKVVLAPLIAVLAAVAVLRAAPMADAPTLVRRASRLLPPLAAGAAFVLALALARLAVDGALPAFLWTAFVYPKLALDHVAAAPLERLADAVAWFAAGFAVWLVPAAPALARCLRRDEPVLMTMMAAWLAAAAVLIVAQRLSWWTYHTLLLATPVAVLAARGFDIVVDRLLSVAVLRRLGAVTVALALVVPAALLGVMPGRDDAVALRNHLDGIRRSVTVLDGLAPGAPIYVLGDPLYYLAAGRRQAVPIQGWSPGHLTPERWRTLEASLRADPPAYVFLEDGYRRFLGERHPPLVAFIDGAYAPAARDGRGVWYRRISTQD